MDLSLFSGSLDFDFPDEARSLGWRPVEDEEVFVLTREVERELPAGHRLKGATLSPLARRDDSDDVLYLVGPVRARLAVVHLTWKVETAPSYPACTVYATQAEWLKDELGGSDASPI